MRYTLHIVPSAEKQFLRLNPSLQTRIQSKFFLLEENPRPQGSQKLHGSDFYRIRIGDYRLIYGIDDKERIVKILDIGHRREVYRGW